MCLNGLNCRRCVHLGLGQPGNITRACTAPCQMQPTLMFDIKEGGLVLFLHSEYKAALFTKIRLFPWGGNVFVSFNWVSFSWEQFGTLWFHWMDGLQDHLSLSVKICWQHCTDINECGEEGKRVYTRPLTAERPILSLDHRNAFTHFLADRKYYYLHTTNMTMYVVAQFSKKNCADNTTNVIP